MRRILEIAGEGRHLAKERGFLVVSCQGQTLGRAPLDAILAVLANGHGLTYSHNALLALAENQVPVILCGRNHSPAAVLYPVESHHRHGARIDAQLAMGKPLKKQLWKQLVSAKIAGQARVLAAHGITSARLEYLAQTVTSGDTGNHEAQAARIYWPLLFGEGFLRDQDGDGLNSLLNYGYTVLRACVARALMATGLHPNIPLHHSNAYNAMRLVDDMMEPYRPFVDSLVKHLFINGVDNLTPEVKRRLALFPYQRLQQPKAATSILQNIDDSATSLAMVLEGQRSTLTVPPPVMPSWENPGEPDAADRIPACVDDGDVRSAGDDSG